MAWFARDVAFDWSRCRRFAWLDRVQANLAATLVPGDARMGHSTQEARRGFPADRPPRERRMRWRRSACQVEPERTPRLTGNLCRGRGAKRPYSAVDGSRTG